MQCVLDFAREAFGLGPGKWAIDRAALLIKASELGSERVALQHRVLEHDTILAREVGFRGRSVFLFPGFVVNEVDFERARHVPVGRLDGDGIAKIRGDHERLGIEPFDLSVAPLELNATLRP